VQRYIGGAALREGRLGLMFNALFKIPMQFFIVMLGALLFVFYQFQPDTPLIFNRAAWEQQANGPQGAQFRAFEERHEILHADKLAKIQSWVTASERGDPAAEASARAALTQAQQASETLRAEARTALAEAAPGTKRTRDSDFVFITFITTQLPSGVVGLLIAVMFASALGSKASELNALGTTSTIDVWRHLRPLAAHDEKRNVRVAKWFTALWGLFAISFALFVSFAENLIEALNIVASIFYPTLLGIFIVAFFIKRVGGTAVFWAAIAAQAVVLAIFFAGKAWPAHEIGYLWLNPIGCAACVLFSLILQALLPTKPFTEGNGANRG
jgi:SSS family solute:Na+ symporter